MRAPWQASRFEPVPGAPLLAAEAVAVEIGGKRILHAADLTVEAGQLVAVVGPNGAGKSTLVRAVAGLQPVSGGSVRCSGVDVGELRGRSLAQLRAFVPQRSRVPDGVSVREAVRIGRSPHIGPLQRMTRADHDAVERALERAGVARFGERRLTTLSGGELQRVQVAVALAQEAPVLLADEPTSHLDLGATATLAKLLRGLTHQGLGVIVVVHDLALAAAIADEVVVVHDGRSIARGTPHDVLDGERLSHVWQIAAELETTSDGRTALHVDWLGEARSQAAAALTHTTDPNERTSSR